MSCKLRSLRMGLESGLLDWQPPRATVPRYAFQITPGDPRCMEALF